jgi:hypothetical protein
MSGPPLNVIAPRLFQAWFAEPSWSVWRSVIKAAFAQTLSPAELETFTLVAGGRDPPRAPIRELWCQVGRRGGKDAVASAIVTAAALVDYQPRLRRGERATCMLLATDKETADICRGYVAAHFEFDAALRSLVVGETQHGLELSNRVDIVIGTNQYRLVRGRTLACVVLDEVAHWRDDNSASPDTEVYTALRPALSTLLGVLIGIGSPYRKSGLLYDKFRRCYGQDDQRVLYVKGPSELFNPTVDREEIAAAYAEDPSSARAEWGAEFRDDLEGFVSVEMVEACTDRGVTVRPPRFGTRYVAFVDAASGAGQDSFAVAVAHRDKVKDVDEIVLDLVHEIRPPFSPSAAIDEVCALLRGYNVASVTGDRWGMNFVAEGFAQHRVKYVYTERDRSQVYVECLPLLTSGRARLIDSKKLALQFVSLERRTSPGGRDRVDHGAHGHDDLCNAAAGALVEAATGRRPMRISQAMVDAAGRPERNEYMWVWGH